MALVPGKSHRPVAPAGAPRALVAVTATVRRQGSRHKQRAAFINASYIRALDDAGLAPVLITAAHSPVTVRALLAACGGLVLTGGEDVAPQRYGAQPHPALGTVTPERDALEWYALELALERQLPVLGICRGIQVLNAFFGGTLYQDLPSEFPAGLDHDPPAGLGERVHTVSVDADSRLHWLVGRREIFTNSSHHQAVRRIAPTLVVTARTEDGLVEAVEAKNGQWVVGVQWHPERYPRLSPTDDPDRLLFAGFRRAVAREPDPAAPRATATDRARRG